MTKYADPHRVAILATDGFEESELVVPRDFLRARGFEVHVLAPHGGTIRGWSRGDWADAVEVDSLVKDADPERFHMLVLPGGVMNPDKLRRDEDVLRFVRAMFRKPAPVAAICHGPWTLIDAGLVRGRRLTSYHSIQTDLKNAGAEWVDAPVVVDRNLITSRAPGDLAAFDEALLRALEPYRVEPAPPP